MDSRFVLLFIACIGIIILFGKTFLFPVKRIARLVGNSVLGALLIFLINLVGISFGFHIGLNIVNSIIVGILGVPGAILLIILKVFCGI